MKIIEKREIPGLAALYLAGMGGEGRLVEFVDTLEPGVAKSEKWVMMISTQVGCAVGCRMCDAGALGFHGNLTAEEMLEQVRYVVARNPALELSRHPKVKIHFARMGEPSLNPEVLKALGALSQEFPYPGILPSLSTVAPKTPVVREFFEELLRIKDSLFSGGRFQLQVSLHAASEAGRRRIVPIRTWSLEELAEYGARFVRPGDRKVTLNFALAAGEGLDAAALAGTFDPSRFLVKITPVNPTRAAEESGAAFVWNEAPAGLSALAAELEARGLQVILSPSMPQELEAETSCGQLWSGSLKERAAVLLRSRGRERLCYVTPESLPAKSEAWKKALEPARRRDLPLSPERAALLVVDMQQFFLSRSSPAYRPQARAILRNVRLLVSAFRAASRPVFMVLHAQEPTPGGGGLMAEWWSKVCVAGSSDAKVAPILEPRRSEIFRKCRYSAFTNPALAKALRLRGVSELVVVGIMTNLCVESAVRDAFDLGFRTFAVPDATAAHTEELHLGSLRSLAQGFSSLKWTGEVLEALGAAAGPLRGQAR